MPEREVWLYASRPGCPFGGAIVCECHAAHRGGEAIFEGAAERFRDASAEPFEARDGAGSCDVVSVGARLGRHHA